MACIARLCNCPTQSLLDMCTLVGLPMHDIDAVKTIFDHVLELVVAYHNLSADEAEIKILTAVKENLVA